MLEFRCEELGVGRAGCDLTLPGKIVSRHHADFHVELDGTLRVTDRGSTNGTFLNGTRLRPDVATTVRTGDQLGIGEWTLDVIADPEPTEKAMARSERLEAMRDRAERARR